MKVSTNNVPRDVTDGFELTDAERAQFDYLNWDKIDEGADSASFVRFKGQLYDLSEFMRVQPGGELAEAGWQGVRTDSFSTGLVVRYAHGDGATVVVGFVQT